MGKVTIKGLLAHKLRLALTALAIVLGVTFISGTLVLTDTLHDTFSTLFGQVYQNVDFQIQGKAAFTGQDNSGDVARHDVPASLLNRVRAISGVADAEGSVTGYAQFVGPDGKAISTGGAPTVGFSYDPNSALSSLRLAKGRAPTMPDEVAMDVGTADKYHFAVGQRVRVLLPGPPRTFTLSGLVTFGSADNLAGATLAAFDLPTAQSLFGLPGGYDAIDVLTSPGADKAQVERAIEGVLPPQTEVVTGQTVAHQQTTAIDDQLSFFSTALVVFALISLFVGGFTIFNTFSILVGQRTKELALLRIVGASRRQIFRSVLAEAGLVGLVASLAGLGLGVLGALGIEALLRGFGITLPTGPLAFESHTVIAALVVGVGVTVISALGPARRAVRIPPVAALTEQTTADGESSRRRLLVGGIVAAGGTAALLAGLAQPAIQVVGLGAVAVFIGIGMLAPVVARPVSAFVGRPLAAALGVSGKLGRENSMRSPRRTAQTASALMVGLALVATIAVFGASLTKSATSSVDEAVSADYIITPSSNGSAAFSNSVGPAAAHVPGVTAVSTVYNGEFETGGSVETLTGISAERLSDTVILRMQSGSAAPSLSAGEVLVDTTTANDRHLAVGSRIGATFARSGTSTLRVGGVFDANPLLGGYVVSDAFFASHYRSPLPVAVLVSTGGNRKAGAALTASIGATYPNLQVQSRAAFENSERKQVDQLLGLVYALLALAVLIALIGIVNTLMLSVFERTHEIGLLRAVGMRRRQVRAMIRSESVILSIFGAIIGVVVGTALGVVFAASLKAQGITDIVIPVPSLILFLVLSAVLGLAAATWPARRAAKLDVLAAIASE